MLKNCKYNISLGKLEMTCVLILKSPKREVGMRVWPRGSNGRAQEKVKWVLVNSVGQPQVVSFLPMSRGCHGVPTCQPSRAAGPSVC